jgi:hypothetical protein
MLAEIVERECHAVMSKFVCILCPLNNLLNFLQDLQTQRTYTFSGNAVLPLNSWLLRLMPFLSVLCVFGKYIKFSHLGRALAVMRAPQEAKCLTLERQFLQTYKFIMHGYY